MQGMFSTDDVEKRDRFAYWSDLVCSVFVQLDCRSASAQSFNGRMQYDALSWLRVVAAESDAIDGVRSRSQIAKGRENDLLVTIQSRGRTTLTQDGRTTVLAPGDFAVYDSERPYTLRFSASTQLTCLQFPRSELISRLGAVEPLVARAVSGTTGVANLFCGLANSLPARVNEVETEDAGKLAGHALDLLALSVRHHGSAPPVLSSPRTIALSRLKRVICNHARDFGLDPSAAAALAGISVRHANRLLATEATSLERFIFSTRLELCHAALADPTRDHHSISEIAYSCGFSDVAHFSRSFRKRYGLSARDFRNANRTKSYRQLSTAKDVRNTET